MEKKPVYSIFPAPPITAHQPSQQQQQQQVQTQPQLLLQKTRHSTESRNRPSLEQAPLLPPCSPLPSVPTSHASLDPPPASSIPQLPPTPDSLRPVHLPSRRRVSPNREFADFQRELALNSSTSSQHSLRQVSPTRGRPRSPRERSASRREDRRPFQHSSSSSGEPVDSIDPEMQTTVLDSSSASSFSLSKPPLLSPTTTVAPSPHPSNQGRYHRPNTVFFHGSIGGAGNYRKVVSENKRAPRAYAANAEPVRRSSPSRLFSSVFGKPKSKGLEIGNGVLDERASGSDESVKQEVDLGAAEALRRKMMGMGRRKKSAT